MKFIKKLIRKIPWFNEFYFFYKVKRKFKRFVENQKEVFKHLIIFNFQIEQDSVDLFLNKGDLRSYLISLHRQDHKIIVFKKLSATISSDIFIDIGANYGEFSAILSSHFKNIFSIEPNPLITTCLKKTLSNLSTKENQICLIDKACTESSVGSIPFEITVDYSGGNHIIQKNEGSTKSILSSLQKFYIEVKKISVESILKMAKEKIKERKLNNNISIKIDVEGCEYQILKGIQSIDKRNHFDFQKVLIMFEFNNNSFPNKKKIFELINYFCSRGYVCKMLPGPPEEYNKIGLQNIDTENIENEIIDNCEILLIKS